MTFKDLIFVLIQVLLLIVFVAIPEGHAATFSLQLTAFLMVVAGIILIATGIFYLGASLTPSPRPKKHASLVTNGVYKYFRHPVYSGIILILTGISLYSLNIPRGIITSMMIVLLYYKSRYEEELLQQQFSEYSNYMKRTGRFFPSFRRRKDVNFD